MHILASLWKISFCLSCYRAALLAGQLSEAPPDPPSRPQSSTTEAEKEKIKEATTESSHTDISLHISACMRWLMMCILLTPQEYEERLAKLQAEYNAEQESKAKLQEDIAILRSSYESKLCNLEKAQSSRGSSVTKNDNRKLPTHNKEPCKWFLDMNSLYKVALCIKSSFQERSLCPLPVNWHCSLLFCFLTSPSELEPDDAGHWRSSLLSNWSHVSRWDTGNFSDQGTVHVC